jgi:hypothetical protein
MMAGLLAAVSIVGCSPVAEPQGFWGKVWKLEVGPDYKRPDLETVKEFRSQLGSSEASSLADLPWWQIFEDKALQELIAEALTHNYDLQLAAARVEQARALVWVAASELYPQAGYQAFAGREKTKHNLQCLCRTAERCLGDRRMGSDSALDRGRARESLCPGGCPARSHVDASQRCSDRVFSSARA